MPVAEIVTGPGAQGRGGRHCFAATGSGTGVANSASPRNKTIRNSRTGECFMPGGPLRKRR